MVPDFLKFFAEISLSRHGSTKPRPSCDSWSQKTYVHKGETFEFATLHSSALIFRFFYFWSSIALNSVHVLTNQVYILTPQVICYHYLPFDFWYYGFWSLRNYIKHTVCLISSVTLCNVQISANTEVTHRVTKSSITL